jgi:hypothetical protein
MNTRQQIVKETIDKITGKDKCKLVGAVILAVLATTLFWLIFINVLLNSL